MTAVRSLAVTVSFLSLFVAPEVAAGAPRVAVQPFGGPETEPYRRQVAKIVARHGLRTLTSLPAVSGTSQYPGLAKDKGISAFVVADADERGGRLVLSFLVWQGLAGSVLGRWEVAAPKKHMSKRLAREFWKRLGPAIGRASAPASDYLGPAPPMRINAGPPARSGPHRRKAAPRPPAAGNRNAPMAVSI